MATTTTNLGLTKPAYADAADVAVFNTNMDLIDSAIGGLQTRVSTAETNITNLQSSVSKKTLSPHPYIKLFHSEARRAA